MASIINIEVASTRHVFNGVANVGILFIVAYVTIIVLYVEVTNRVRRLTYDGRLVEGSETVAETEVAMAILVVETVSIVRLVDVSVPTIHGRSINSDIMGLVGRLREVDERNFEGRIIMPPDAKDSLPASLIISRIDAKEN